MFRIDKGIDIPKVNPSKGRPKATISDLFRRMEVGDSFKVPGKNLDANKVISRFHGPAKSVGQKIAVRRVEGGYRVWRVE